MEEARTEPAGGPPPSLFLPSRRSALIVAVLGGAALGGALYLRYGVVQNTPLGLSCEGGLEATICPVRLIVIQMFNKNVFGWIAMIAAAIQLWRPNLLAFGIGVVVALAGLVLYNTSAAALATALLVLSLARPAPEGPSRPAL